MTPLDAAIYRGNKGCAKYIQLHGGYSAAKLTSKNALQKAMNRLVSKHFYQHEIYSYKSIAVCSMRVNF